MGIDPRLEFIVQVSLAHDDGNEVWNLASHDDELLNEQVKPLHRYQSPNGNHGWRLRTCVARCKAVFNSWCNHVNLVAMKVELFHNFLPGRLRQGQDATRSIHKWCQTPFNELPDSRKCR